MQPRPGRRTSLVEQKPEFEKKKKNSFCDLTLVFPIWKILYHISVLGTKEHFFFFFNVQRSVGVKKKKKKFYKAPKKSGQQIWRRLTLEQASWFRNVPPQREREPSGCKWDRGQAGSWKI